MGFVLRDGDGTGAYHVHPTAARIFWDDEGDLFVYDRAGQTLAIYDGEHIKSVERYGEEESE